MQSDAITLAKAMLDQSTREAIDSRGQSFISPDFIVFDESNVSWTCFRTMI
jgi:hypothetical protein